MSLPDWDDNPVYRSAHDARGKELLLAICREECGWMGLLMTYSRDAVECGDVPEAVFAVCRAFRDMAFGTQGKELTLARLESDLRYHRAEAIREATDDHTT